MTACISPNAILSHFTLDYLNSMGPYDMLVDNYGLHSGIIRESAQMWNGTAKNQCNFTTFECSVLEDSEGNYNICENMCVSNSGRVVASEVDILVIDAILRGDLPVIDLMNSGPNSRGSRIAPGPWCVVVGVLLTIAGAFTRHAA